MKTRLSIFAAWAVLLLTASCTSDEVETPVIIPDSGQVYTYKMNLNVDPVPSDLQSDGNTRATTTTWADGSTLRFYFFDQKDVMTPGKATYSATADEWTVATNRALSATSRQLSCSALYLQPDAKGDTLRFLTPSYFGTSSYTLANKTISVDALTLDPATWRLRFKGTKGQALAFFSNQVRDHNCQPMTDSLRLTIGSNGYSPYIYATFATGSNDSINVRTDNLYSRPMAAMNLGTSTTLTIPTSSTYEADGWKIIKEVLPPVEREAVDLGLPSGTLWANMNVGASRPEEYGDYFAWGETKTKNVFSEESYIFSSFENIGSDIAGTAYDAATANWGNYWQMPTRDQFQELFDNCNSKWMTQNGVSGRKFTSKKNGSSIFLPAAGFINGTGLNETDKMGSYWSSTLSDNSIYFANDYSFDATHLYGAGSISARSNGHPVRPVQKKYSTTVSATELSFDADADSKDITVTSNEGWTAKVVEGSSWCSVTTSGNTLKVKVTANTTESVRIARITVTGKSSGMSNNIIVTQKGKQTLPDTGDALTITANGVSFKMIRVKSGTFRMGTDQGDEKSPHDVTLSNDYYVAETEVTQALWKAVMKQTKNWNSTNGEGDQYPAYNISWNDCETFIAELNKLTGREFRLPTEAEWDFAARGGNKSKGYTYSGSNTCDEVAWYDGNSSNLGTTHPDYGSHPVKAKKPNELGLYDMSGNVKEWCSDWYADKYNNGYSFAQTDPKGPNSGTSRVLRGGSWAAGISFCRISARDKSSAGSAHFGNGLRLVLTASGSSGNVPSEVDAIYVINYSNNTDFPFYVMGYVPEWIDGVMTDFGANYKYVAVEGAEETSDVVITARGVKYYRIELTTPQWHQYFIADGIPTENNGSYRIKAMVKASEPVTINVSMGWGWGDGQQLRNDKVSIGTKWKEVEWEYSGIGGSSCNLVAQPGTATATIEWKHLTVFELDR